MPRPTCPECASGSHACDGTAWSDETDAITRVRLRARRTPRGGAMSEDLTGEKDRLRGTGGNRFIKADATRADLMRTINDQLGDLHEYAAETGRALDLAEVTISTRRIATGRISVSVTADLALSERPSSTTATNPEEES